MEEDDIPLNINLNTPLGIARRNAEAGEKVYIAAVGPVPNGNMIPTAIYSFEAARKIYAGEVLYAKDIRVEDMLKKKPEPDMVLMVEESLEDFKERVEAERNEPDPWKQRIAEARARREEP